MDSPCGCHSARSMGWLRKNWYLEIGNTLTRVFHGNSTIDKLWSSRYTNINRYWLLLKMDSLIHNKLSIWLFTMLTDNSIILYSDCDNNSIGTSHSSSTCYYRLHQPHVWKGMQGWISFVKNDLVQQAPISGLLVYETVKSVSSLVDSILRNTHIISVRLGVAHTSYQWGWV
jgi:hypothetical protein